MRNKEDIEKEQLKDKYKNVSKAIRRPNADDRRQLDFENFKTKLKRKQEVIKF